MKVFTRTSTLTPKRFEGNGVVWASNIATVRGTYGSYDYGDYLWEIEINSDLEESQFINSWDCIPEDYTWGKTSISKYENWISFNSKLIISIQLVGLLDKDYWTHSKPYPCCKLPTLISEQCLYVCSDIEEAGYAIAISIPQQGEDYLF